MHCSRTLQLYVLREILKVFLLAAVAVNLVMNFAAIITYLHKFPLPLIPLIKIVLCRMPELFPYTFPMALLLAVTLVYGRLATDNEIMAMRASGIHMAWIMLPGLAVGLLLSVTLYLVNDHLLPYCKRKEYQIHRTEAVNIVPQLFLSRKSYDFGRYQLSWENARGNTLYKLTLTQRNDKGETVMRCQAETASYRIMEVEDPETGKSTMQIELRGKTVSGIEYPDTRFKWTDITRTIPLKKLEPSEPGPKARSTSELLSDLDSLKQDTPRENRRLHSELEKVRKGIDRKIRGLRKQMREENIEEVQLRRLKKQVEKYQKQLARKRKDTEHLVKANTLKLQSETNEILMRIHLRLSLAASAFALPLLGIPLGILSGRSHMLRAFILACVPVLLFYYPLFMLGRNLAETRVLSEGVAIWSPTLLLMGIGTGFIAYLFRR